MVFRLFAVFLLIHLFAICRNDVSIVSNISVMVYENKRISFFNAKLMFDENFSTYQKNKIMFFSNGF